MYRRLLSLPRLELHRAAGLPPVAGSLLFMLLVLLVSPALGQAPLPAGWEQLPAAEFATVSEEFFAAGPAEDAAREVVRHAWQTFLNDEPFVTSGDWDTVERLMKHFLALQLTGAQRGSIIPPYVDLWR